ncbi:unnamed protein product, partial [Adineta steineri]
SKSMTLTDDLTLAQLILSRYVLIICSILGIIGCFLNFIIFCKKKLRKSSCSVYFQATSIFNLLVILIAITPVIVGSYLPKDPASYLSAYCKARAYTTHAFLMMSRSSVALSCIDRFALCSSHAYIRRLNHRGIAIILVVITIIIWLLIPIHVMVYTDVQSSGKCGTSGSYQIFYSFYAIIVTSIPLLIMIIFSVWAVRNIRRSRARVAATDEHVNGNENSRRKMKKEDIQLMIIVISEAIVYLLSTIWYPIYTAYTTITANVSKTSDRVAIENFIRYLVLSFLIFLNSCSIFYVHLLASKTLRQECKQLIFYLFKHNQINVELQTNSSARPGHRQRAPALYIHPPTNIFSSNKQ